MSPEELIQLMRTCNLKQVREQLEYLAKKDREAFDIVVACYKLAALRKK